MATYEYEYQVLVTGPSAATILTVHHGERGNDVLLPRGVVVFSSPTLLSRARAVGRAVVRSYLQLFLQAVRLPTATSGRIPRVGMGG